MKNKAIILLFVAIFLPLIATNAQGAPPESTIEQLQQRIEKLEQNDTALQKQLEVATRIFTRALYRGTTGDQVRALQEFLKQFPDIYPEGFITGYFGPLTHNAVTRFQTKEGILALGIVGPITRARLNELMTVIDVETGTPGPAGATGAAGLAGPTGGVGPNFLTVSVVSGNINKNHTFFIISGGSFTTGNAYCVMATAPGANKTDTFIISVGGTTIGMCIVSGVTTFGTTTLTPVGISPGTVVQITTSTNGSGRVGALTIAP